MRQSNLQPTSIDSNNSARHVRSIVVLGFDEHVGDGSVNVWGGGGGRGTTWWDGRHVARGQRVLSGESSQVLTVQGGQGRGVGGGVSRGRQEATHPGRRVRITAQLCGSLCYWVRQLPCRGLEPRVMGRARRWREKGPGFLIGSCCKALSCWTQCPWQTEAGQACWPREHMGEASWVRRSVRSRHARKHWYWKGIFVFLQKVLRLSSGSVLVVRMLLQSYNQTVLPINWKIVLTCSMKVRIVAWWWNVIFSCKAVLLNVVQWRRQLHSFAAKPNRFSFIEDIHGEKLLSKICNKCEETITKQQRLVICFYLVGYLISTLMQALFPWKGLFPSELFHRTKHDHQVLSSAFTRAIVSFVEFAQCFFMNRAAEQYRSLPDDTQFHRTSVPGTRMIQTKLWCFMKQLDFGKLWVGRHRAHVSSEWSLSSKPPFQTILFSSSIWSKNYCPVESGFSGICGSSMKLRDCAHFIAIRLTCSWGANFGPDLHQWG